MYKTKETVITELKEIFIVSDFESKEINGGYESNGKFYINKSKMLREEVIEKLKQYFNGVCVKNGYVKIEELTLLYTKFYVCEGKP